LFASEFFAVLAADVLFAQAKTNLVAAMDKDFVKTNGQYVTIGNMMYDTNSPSNTEEFKQYMWRVYELRKLTFWCIQCNRSVG